MSKKIIYSLWTICISFAISHTVLADPNKKPNVIYIYASDLGKGLLSAYGQKHFTTPNIDRLINDGVSFSNAYGGSLTAFARASLFTGYHDCKKNKWRIENGGIHIREDTTQIMDGEAFINNNAILLPEDDYYLAQIFQKAGYVTGQIGKLGIGNASSRQQMKRYGWDYYYGFLDLVRSKGYYPPFLFENDQIVLIEGNTRRNGGAGLTPENDTAYKERWDMKGKKTYAPDLFVNKIIDFLRECKDLPFFLMYSTTLPQGPVSVPAVHPEVAGNDALTPVEKEYASMVKLLDEQVGIIINELRALNLEDHTIIVFTSDNGHELHYLQEGRLERPLVNKKTNELFDNIFNKYYSATAGDIFNGNAGLAGLKNSNLEGGIRVPLTFYWKGRLKKSVCTDIVSGYDLLPTMADLTGVRLQTKKDGISYLPVLMKGKKLPKQRYIITGSGEGPVMITNEGWKLRYYKNTKQYELYNLQKDVEEKYNVILRFPDVAEKMKKTLIEECNGDIDTGILY